MRLATDRLVELAFKSIYEWATVLPALGATIKVHEDGTANLGGIVRSGIFEGADPITKAVTLGFAFGGMFWPQVFPDLLKEVRKEWKRRCKAGLPIADDPPTGTMPAVLIQETFLEATDGTE